LHFYWSGELAYIYVQSDRDILYPHLTGLLACSSSRCKVCALVYQRAGLWTGVLINHLHRVSCKVTCHPHRGGFVSIARAVQHADSSRRRHRRVPTNLHQYRLGAGDWDGRNGGGLVEIVKLTKLSLSSVHAANQATHPGMQGSKHRGQQPMSGH
jgi:hypothetical protein